MKRIFYGVVTALFLQSPVTLANDIATETPKLAPQPTPCISAVFSKKSRGRRDTVTLRLTNNCSTVADFQNSVITFVNRTALNTSFWGDFSPLSYPDNTLRITSQLQSNGSYIASLNLHFPTSGNSKLPIGKTIRIIYDTRTADYVQGSVNVYLGTTVDSGSIQLTNTSAKPTNVTQNYALVHLSMNGTNISDVQLPWSGAQTVSSLAVGTYALTADTVTDSAGNQYQGTVTPASLNVIAGQTATASVAYQGTTPQPGKVNIAVQPLPTELSGYTLSPVVSVIETANGSATPVTVNWSSLYPVTGLKLGSTYRFTSETINFNGYQCVPFFDPSSLTATETGPITNMHVPCTQVGQTRVTVNVVGGPASLTSLKITLTPNNNSAPVIQTITLNNGSGSASVNLSSGVVYTVAADPVSGYAITYNPQPLTATNNGVETITLTASNTGTPVSRNGQLRVCGNKLCNEQGAPIQLKGMSSHGIQWYGWQGSNTQKPCLTTASLDTLKAWGASVMRISMYVQEGGYETDPTGFTNQVNQLIDEATRRGIYAIVDWHQLDPGDPNYNLARAKTFFTAIATAHKNNNNLLYEIANEPSGVNWASIKSYAEQLIPVIRAIDPKTVIIVGTPGWSSLGVSDGRTSQDIINAPVNATNIMYTFHFYAASHKDAYINELDRASNTLPIFVTEFGTQTYTGDGANDFAMTDRYMQLMANKQISWSNWNYSDDFRSGAVWKTGTCSNGPWTDASLKPAGVYIKGKIQS